MPGHAGVRWFQQNAANASFASVSDASSHVSSVCGHCGKSVQAAVLVQVHEAGFVPVAWLRCPACHKGSVVVNGRQYPGAVPGEDLEGLPPEVEAAYIEAREAMGVHAFTAGELMCRKILMHVAVDKGATEGDTFAAYIDFLEGAGYITPPMKPWAEVIRKHGNSATHKIPPADDARGLGTLAFTTQLLRMIYEMDHKVSQYLAPPAAT